LEKLFFGGKAAKKLPLIDIELPPLVETVVEFVEQKQDDGGQENNGGEKDDQKEENLVDMTPV